MVRKFQSNPNQVPLGFMLPESSWKPPTELPDLIAGGVKRIALDTETKDDGLAIGRGPGWPYAAGHIAGVSMAWAGGSIYAPITHPDTENFSKEQVKSWVTHHVRAGIQIIFQNAPYDIGWMATDFDLKPPEHIDDTQAMAVMLDENRLSYSLDNICKWQGVPGKDESVLKAAAAAYGFDPKKDLYRMPARYVGPYAEQDGVSTLGAADVMLAKMDQEQVLGAYQLEMDLIPMVHEMRRRGVKISVDRAQATVTDFLEKRDLALKGISDRVGGRRNVTISDLTAPTKLAKLFDAESIPYPFTKKSKEASFQTDWMKTIDHWLPQGVIRALKYHDAGTKFIEGFILDYAHKGRIHAEIHQYRSDDGGTRSHRFSYSDPPLQQMPSRDPEIGPAIRGLFEPEDGEIWCASDYSQQEYRLIVHFAAKCRIAKAEVAVEQYVSNPKTDFHKLVVDWTGLDRKKAKDTNFAKAFGAGVPKFASMIGKSIEEAQAIYTQYDEFLPFVKGLAEFCTKRASARGFIKLIDGARSHFDMWEPTWYKGPFHPACSIEEARRRVADKEHDWYQQKIRRAMTHKAMNRLIQGSAARQTKLAMRACWQEGLVPLLQMHDELDHSVGTRTAADRVKEIMTNVVRLEVPVMVDSEVGPTWGKATQTWEELAA